MNKISKQLLKIASQLNKIGKITYYSDLDDCNDRNLKQFANLGFCSCIAIQQYESQSELDDEDISQQIQKTKNEIKSNISKNIFADGMKVYRIDHIYFVGFVVAWNWTYQDDDQDECLNSEKQLIIMLKKYENKFDIENCDR